MRVVNSIAQLREWRSIAGRLAFVPTMGNLHAGHMALVRLARQHAPCVAVSIFVNRLQFAPAEDFGSYPRTFEDDCAKLEAAGVELLFAPDETVLYPEPQGFIVEPPPLANELEGAFRQRFFHGVTTVVLKLFNCVRPEVAVFGKKDYQQLMMMKGMVRQFNLPIQIVAAETEREPDGLAMSSRNGYLSASERAEAPRLHRLLTAIAAGSATCGDAIDEITAAGWKPDYFEIRRRCDLAPAQAEERERVVLAAARLGSTRLIDNLEF